MRGKRVCGVEEMAREERVCNIFGMKEIVLYLFWGVFYFSTA